MTDLRPNSLTLCDGFTHQILTFLECVGAGIDRSPKFALFRRV